MLLIHSWLCDFLEKRVNKWVVKVALLGCHSACFAAQYINYYLAIVTLLDCKIGAVRAFCVFDG